MGLRTEAPTHRGGGNDRTGKINRGLEWGPLKLKIIIHVFGLSWCPTYRRHGMPPRDMRAYWKGVMWLGTNMWMSLCSFRDNFGFHEK